ncbi:hypothetical protein Tco_1058787 [Tanacetum coccineum]|uniref:Uncharacterized protein n=1 Tax=Tanacetum coccineum TaxID=301880 RepID=A0ABQ5H9V7_9ASTR
MDEDIVRQKAIMELAVQFDNASTAKDDLRKAYEKCNDIPQESRALIDTFLKQESDKDYEIKLAIAFGGVEDEEVVVGEGVVVTSSSLEMLTNSYLGGIMVSLIFLEGLEEEALVEFMVELCEEDEDGGKNEKDGLFNLKANDQSRKA